EEAIAWARLDGPVQKQLQGMRQKIEGVDLRNIKRFIGKSGETKKGKGKRTIYGKIKHFPETAEEQAVFVKAENERDLRSLEDQHKKGRIQKDEFDSEKARLTARTADELRREMEVRLQALEKDPNSASLAEKAVQ